jgi:uncharacterized protein YjiS (DUF1127 family)
MDFVRLTTTRAVSWTGSSLKKSSLSNLRRSRRALLSFKPTCAICPKLPNFSAVWQRTSGDRFAPPLWHEQRSDRCRDADHAIDRKKTGNEHPTRPKSFPSPNAHIINTQTGQIAQIANLFERILAMTLLNITPHHGTVASAIQRRAGLFLTGMGRTLKRWIAAVIAERARQADIIVLRQLNDRELKDIGLTRGDLREGLMEAARSRNRMQQSRRP